mmetsp:Transcript_6147/g.13281  ORF Transcript_6147/g.13281 Transcript_6147/m.13281 type:complete len:341 (-) Transcript_6147:773-1795(-)|eukprot:CAMPEP_0113310356 /NCGR_PEP_ID=MMETSP0010_2-20120614/8036_1 /TAXON_ID=216773 ORGANISM="Corethron hystrix, Strain 308" /NCGR_SAMPLE_ID=MMETSP0010_2 /ASSEMBLY_ACC=CAM_ASM_000155 /LENGTH=340 /DNA_ID=CAMNT_0000165799 /DNA_START=145 /DNA_END=1167 /DNA_ORIENTATION=- /assembly_acc=CAM_ASM_000155
MAPQINGTSAQEEEEKDNEEQGFYEIEKNLNKLCDFLRSNEGPVVREAVEMDKRVYYLKGEKLVNFLFEPKKGVKWPKSLPRFASRQDAIDVCKNLCDLHYMHRSEKVGKGELAVSRVRDFDETAYFTWMYEGNKAFSHMMTTLLIIGFLFFTCYPIWPQWLKIFAWYMSVTFLIVVFSICLVRGSIFTMVWILGYDFWILPNLFDEELNVSDSFKPLYSLQKSAPGQGIFRLGVLVGVSSFCWWAITQPSEFDGMLAAQKSFIDDLYSGNLLSDTSQNAKDNIDKPFGSKSLEELLEDLDSADDRKENEAPKIVTEEEKLDSMFDNLMDEEEDIDPDIE